MAATTGQLGFVTPTQGTLTGTWGDTVNNGITEYTNIAIAGTLTLTGDGAVTLANTTGDNSASNITSTLTGAGTVTAQFAIVRVTGTLTTAKVVTGPSYSKTYTVVNAATGGIVTFKASGQTGVSVAVGESAFVYFNGTDYVKLVGTATAGAAGGSNTQVQFNSSGILSGSSSLTWDGTTLSSTQVNITGQGTLRLQDTTGGEYVGLRSPSALGASYTLTFPADDGTSGQALITDGSGGLSWSTAASGDVYGPASSTDNAVARFDSTTGKLLQNSVVIIGDTGDVSGVGTLSAATLNLTNALGVAYGGTGQTTLATGALGYGQGTSAHASLAIGTAGQVLTVNSGATAPQWSTLSGVAVTTFSAGTTGFTPSSATAGAVTLAGTLATTNGGTGLTSFTSGGVVYASSTSALATGSGLIFNGANLGIGVTPSAWAGRALQIGLYSGYGIDGNGNAFMVNNAYNDTSSSYRYVASSLGAGQYRQAFGTHAWYTAASGTAGDVISFSQGMTLTSTGLGIGTSSPAAKLDVVGRVLLKSTTDQFGLGLGYSSSASAFYYIGASANTTPDLVFTNGGVAEVMRLTNSGNLGLGVTPNASTLGTIQSAWGVFTGNFQINIAQNAYYDSVWKYTTTAGASLYFQDDGAHNWKIAASGTAGTAITFTQAMTLDASGNLALGTTSPAQKFHINSASGSLYALISSGANNVYIGYNSGSTLGVIESNNSLAFNVGSSYTERLRIASNGAWGLGGANYGTSGQVLTSGGSGAAPTWATPSGGSTANAQTFTTSGTWTKPAGVTFVQVCVWGAGGGGGSGRFAASGNRGGGAGAGGGARVSNTYFAACLTATVTVTVGAGGAGGAAKTTTANGSDGSVGGTSSFGCYVKAFGGGAGEAGFQANCGSRGGGGGGSVSAGATNTAGYPRSLYFGYTAVDSRGQNLGTGGGVGSAGTGVNFYPAGASEYGGGGGGATRSQTYVAGVGGGSIFGGAGGGAGSSSTGSCPLAAAAGGSTDYTPSSGGGGAAGSGGAGGAGSTQANGSGSGGGGGGTAPCCRGYNGGAGGAYGGGGGGGGYGQVTTSGAGGTGGAGGVKVYSW